MEKKHQQQASVRPYAHLGVSDGTTAAASDEIQASGRRFGRTSRRHRVVDSAEGFSYAVPGDADSYAKRRKHSALLPLGIIVGVLAVAYFIGVALFNYVFYPHTTLEGEDVSLQPVTEVADANSVSVTNHTLTVTTADGGSFEVSGSAVGLRLDTAAYAHDAVSQQNPWMWPVEVLSSRTIASPARASYDEGKLKAAVKQQVEAYNETAKAPVNATAAYNEDTGLYEITPEAAGTTLAVDAVTEQVAQAMAEVKQSIQLDDSAYEQPTVKSDDKDLKAAVDEVNAHLGATQSLTVGGKEVATVGASQIAQWVSIDDKLQMAIDTDAITTWCKGDLSKELDTIGTTRTYTTPDGKTYSVTGGEYGWCIDGATLATSIADAIKAGKAGTIEVPMKTKAAKWGEGGADWGDRWVDVNIKTQHATFYDGGEVIWESDIVSGKVDGGYDTPQGVYQINSYMSSVESGGEQVKLVSPEKDEKTGDPTYISYVDYWMPFVGNLVAFHDASWRSSFGDDIYKSNGSHGCVNLPADKAKELYHIIKVGDVVVVHS